MATTFRELLDRIRIEKANFVIQVQGAPVAVLIPYEDFLALESELENLQLARDLQQTREEVDSTPLENNLLDRVAADELAAAETEEEAAFWAMSVEEQERYLEMVAQEALPHYLHNKELTAFTALDVEDFYDYETR
jgi:PHD/YefM family antitoxin component YafN of YafNO toxin-antitoxin module